MCSKTRDMLHEDKAGSQFMPVAKAAYAPARRSRTPAPDESKYARWAVPVPVLMLTGHPLRAMPERDLAHSSIA